MATVALIKICKVWQGSGLPTSPSELLLYAYAHVTGFGKTCTAHTSNFAYLKLATQLQGMVCRFQILGMIEEY